VNAGERRGATQPGHRVLVIAPMFPPSCGSGVQRTLKFVRYLPEFGWRCTVLTRDPEAEGVGLLDREVEAEAQAAHMVRVAYRNPFGWLERWVHDRRMGGWCSRQIARFLSYFWAPLPGDPYVWWALRARRTVLRLAHEEKPDIVYTSGPPHSVHLLGLWLKRRTRLPLVCDFRDAWSVRPLWGRRRFSQRIDRVFERRVLRRADRIICINEPIREDFERIEPACRGKGVVIENGFDPVDFEGLPLADTPRAQEATRLFHVGFVQGGAAGPILRALAALREAEPGSAAKLHVSFVRGLNSEDEKLFKLLNLKEMVHLLPGVAHRAALRAMCEADVLLLLLENSLVWRPVHTGKVYEYLASGKPILAVVPDGLAGELVTESGAGLAVRPDDEEALLDALRLAAEGPDAFRRLHYAPRADVIARYERRGLTEKLARVFDRLVERDPA